MTTTASPGSRAVVLGGGGLTGIAWEIGVLAGLRDEGIDLRTADALIGTSAGAFAATYLAFDSIDRHWEDLFAPDSAEITGSMSPESMQAFGQALAEGAGDPVRTGKALGALALGAQTVPAQTRAAVVAHRLPYDNWPDAPLKLTAIDADTGELHVLDRDSGISLVTAATASGAVPGLWPFVTAGERRWIDGGSCSPTNAALAAGYDSIVVIAPIPTGLGALPSPADEVELLRQNSQVAFVTPDEQTTAAIGANVFDPAYRGAAGKAGRRQGRAAADDIRRVWSRLS
ncbi:patatin-like phospholipase family protein [Nocardia salmonicida]|uniref:patatin-like phospholipase family protein n=1 Tax=Nocardia salmonicida TaxID=53431 RepID=UPI0033C7E09F